VSEVEFACLGVAADRYAAVPTVRLAMSATETTGARVHALALRCQVRIEPRRRTYDDDEVAALADLFGERRRWSTTAQALQLAFLSHMLPSFTGTTTFDLALPCSYDFDVAAHRYLHAVRDGDMPLLLLFSGTVISGHSGSLDVSPVPWHREARVGLPVAVWREAMDAHFPGQAWLRLHREVFDRLAGYRTRHQLAGWDDTVERLLKEAE
jgi:hypothetical protein